MPTQATGRFPPRVRRSSGIHELAWMTSLATASRHLDNTGSSRGIQFEIGGLNVDCPVVRFLQRELGSIAKREVSKLKRSGNTSPRPSRLQIHARVAIFSRFAELLLFCSRKRVPVSGHPLLFETNHCFRATSLRDSIGSHRLASQRARCPATQSDKRASESGSPPAWSAF
jgi:hypothetical protein